MKILARLLVAIVPLLLTLVFVWLISGPLSLGGGEKDLFLAVPMLVWSVMFFAAILVLGWRKVPIGRSAAVAAGIATALLVGIWVAFAVAWQFGLF